MEVIVGCPTIILILSYYISRVPLISNLQRSFTPHVSLIIKCVVYSLFQVSNSIVNSYFWAKLNFVSEKECFFYDSRELNITLLSYGGGP